MSEYIGFFSLNLSFLLYLILYIPQLIHNQKITNIAELSFNLHILLYLSFFFDLWYGFSNQLPWQYKVVSIVGLLLVFVQHIQLLKFFRSVQFLWLQFFSYLIIIGSLSAIYWFFLIKQTALNQQTTLFLGSFARLCGLIYCLPQIKKNKAVKSAKALSIHFIYLSIILSFLDTVSSWCLDWGWPNKLAAPMSLMMMCILLSQAKKYVIPQVRHPERS